MEGSSFVHRFQQPANSNRRHDRQYFYKYVTPSTAKAILTNRALRWSSPLVFNDPFDVPPKLSFEFTARELQEVLAEDLATMVESGAPTPPNAMPLLGVLLRAIRNSQNPATRRVLASDLRTEALKHIPVPAIGLNAFQDFWDESIPKMRILCVSENATSTVMWAHYAENHEPFREHRRVALGPRHLWLGGTLNYHDQLQLALPRHVLHG